MTNKEKAQQIIDYLMDPGDATISDYRFVLDILDEPPVVVASQWEDVPKVPTTITRTNAFDPRCVHCNSPTPPWGSCQCLNMKAL